MGLKVGIVELPNSGKSTIFNAVTNSDIEAENYIVKDGDVIFFRFNV